MGSFILYVLDAILKLLELAIILNAILSWLVAFDVINLRNRFMAQLARFLDAVTMPVLGPFRRIVPTFGQIDVSPIIALIVLEGVRAYLLPWLFSFIIPIIG